MQTQLVTLVLAIWAAFHPGADRIGAAPEIANAIATIVQQDAALPPVYGSHDEDLAIMSYFAMRESWLNPRAVGDGGAAHGVWQIHGWCGKAPVVQQARCWMSMLRQGQKLCPQAPSAVMWGGCSSMIDPTTHVNVVTLAKRREANARELLRAALAKLSPPEPPVDGVADTQPTADLDAGAH